MARRSASLHHARSERWHSLRRCVIFRCPQRLAMLCVSGICDFRSLKREPAALEKHDAFAYVIAAFACAAIASAHGATLLNPRFTIALWASSAALVALAYVHRHARTMHLRWAPIVMTLGALFSHSAPSYTITETTLNDAAPGDAIVFRGILARDGNHDALVRYAITCCRADAQPVVVRLEHPLRERSGDWFSARGTLVGASTGIALRIRQYEKINAPSDPFIYR